ncbi:tripartite tricarboxylate transporter substrate binding protein [Polynucleobacter sp. MWH-Loch1C5]|uniref:Bug family tripartite tricarboxylate transporter substrate binding protein n=1 Tax=Polynucleobacter sp. MWH-Loch1C5 TaxID=2689108 RepID=UPI001C0BB13D|nr:tripartite tricarboxylate transporter substrate binding protein [Polynucleobacter sp. MWH-Loch1C5]MBU3541948.1 tripartite tricarboxylate transporter substrate binding protein [Polynucleobacter sp. MWH-Loch1C5]
MKFIRLILAITAFLSITTVHAQQSDWPNKPVRWIVPFPAGGAMDVIARSLGEKLSARYGQPFIIENKPGAGGNIGSEFVARASNDGHTILITSIGMVTNQYLYSKLSYDPKKDFSPVSVLAVVPNVLVTQVGQLHSGSVSEVIALAKTNPGKLTYASAGNGTSIHLAGEVFKSMAKIDIQHIPYKGSSPAVVDVIGGQVNYMFDSITSARPHIQSGKLKPIAVTTAKRSKSLPNVPTVAESGLPAYEVSPWFAVFVPSGTSKQIIEKMNAAFIAALKDSDIQTRFDTIGAEGMGLTVEQTQKFISKEDKFWSEIIRKAQIKAD